MQILQFITDFGDQALLLPLAFGVLLIFALVGWIRGVLAWGAAIGSMLMLMLFLKLHFLSCVPFAPDTALRTPSGHTAASAAVYGGMLAIAARLTTGTMRWTLACTLAAALIVGTTRLLLGVHTLAEVLVGGLVGMAAAVAATVLAGPPPARLRLRDMGVLALLILVILHGLRLPAEAAIRTLSIHVPPFACF